MGIMHKLSLYTDDLVLYNSNPVSSIPIIEDIIIQFGKYSAYKLNFNKCELLPISDLAKPQPSYPFKAVPEGFRYFRNTWFEDLFSKNFCPLVYNCKLDMTRSSVLLKVLYQAS